MKKFLALLLSVAMLLVPMTALAVELEPAVDYVYDKITITGSFDAADFAEDRIATLLVLNDGKNFDNLVEDIKNPGFINWADQCLVDKEGKFTFVINAAEIADGTYKFQISAPGVDKTFNGEFTYAAADMEKALMEKLNDSSVKNKGMHDFIVDYAKNRITELDKDVVADYESLNNTDAVDEVMVRGRDYADLDKFVKALRKAVNDQKDHENKPSGGGNGGSGSSFSGGAGAALIAPQVTNPFLDIGNSYWGKDAIIDLYNKGIVKGQGNGYFRPDNTITRAEFVQMVVMAFGFGMQGEGVDFADVADSDWFANSVQAAYANGVVNGTSATTFSPLANITRQDMMTILYNAAKAKGINLTSANASFTDADYISAYAQDAVAAMVGSKVVSGYTDGSVKPLNNASRAEAAAMLSRLLGVK